MTFTQEAVRALVGSKKAMGMTHEEVRDYFKTAFEQKMISVEIYTIAVEETTLAYEQAKELFSELDKQHPLEKGTLMSEESYKDKIEEMLKDQVNNHGDDDHTDMGSNLDKHRPFLDEHRPSPPGIGFGRGYVPDGMFSNALETDAAEPDLRFLYERPS